MGFDMATEAIFSIGYRRTESIEVAQIAIYACGKCVSRLLRREEREPSEYLLAPPEELARWLASNWWRIRWEAVPLTDELTESWRIAHDLRSVGGGYAWPNLLIWGEDARVAIRVQPDPVGVVGPVQFLAQAFEMLPAANFESGVDHFFQQIRANISTELRELIDALYHERVDPELSIWRRLEARLGFDPDRAPDSVMNELDDLMNRYKAIDIEEAASAAPGPDSARLLREEIEHAQGEQAWECNLARIGELKSAGWLQQQLTGRLSQTAPWKQGEMAAIRFRREKGIAGPISNNLLSELLEVKPEAFDALPPQTKSQKLPYALYISGNGSDRILPRSNWPAGRRFEFARALGDFIGIEPSNNRELSLAPIAPSKTRRQKFQRSFAATFLCPLEELTSYMNTDQPEEEDISAAAQHFSVSNWLVESTLMNNGLLPRREFGQIVEGV